MDFTRPKRSPAARAATLIPGVKITDLKVFEDERGSVRHMMARGRPPFEQFGEIYFSSVKPMVVKAWHMHTQMTLNYVCLVGSVMVGLVDTRTSPLYGTYGAQSFHVLNTDSNYFLLTIPPGIWNGFRVPLNVPQEEALVANCATLPHDPDEIIRVHPDDFEFEFYWGDYDLAG